MLEVHSQSRGSTAPVCKHTCRPDEDAAPIWAAVAPFPIVFTAIQPAVVRLPVLYVLLNRHPCSHSCALV